MSSLLALPPEIRDRIYEYALRADQALVTFRLDSFQREIYQEAVQPSLLAVNRQIREEALAIFYASNVFIFHLEGAKLEEAHQWLHRTRPYQLMRGAFRVRYLTRTHHTIGPVGALEVAMHYIPRQGQWSISPKWRWVTVNRCPDDAATDGDFLVEELRSITQTERHQSSAEMFASVMSRLRISYIKHKDF